MIWAGPDCTTKFIRPTRGRSRPKSGKPSSDTRSKGRRRLPDRRTGAGLPVQRRSLPPARFAATPWDIPVASLLVKKRVLQAGGRGSKFPPPRPPPPGFAEIDPTSGCENGKERSFSLENRMIRRKNPPAPSVHAAGCEFYLRGLRPSQTLPESFDTLRRPGTFPGRFRHPAAHRGAIIRTRPMIGSCLIISGQSTGKDESPGKRRAA